MSEPVPVLWGMKTAVGIISEHVVNELRIAGHADLVDGAIAFGAKAAASRKSPPRIVFVPVGSTFYGSDYGTDIFGEGRVRPVVQSLATDNFAFDVHVWGSAEPPDPDGGDLDDARYLIHQVVRVCLRIADVAVKPIRVTYDPDPASTLGQHATLRLEMATPVVEARQMYVPAGTVAQITIENDVPEVAEVINLPATGT
jgi:hypothetical protein